MRTLKQTVGFILFALALQAMWMLLRVDILEDLNLFAEACCWSWFVGAVVLFALLAAVAGRIQRPVVRCAGILGVLALVFGIGLLVPFLMGGDGLAVGMLQFLNGYWVVSVAVYWVLVVTLRKKVI